MKRTNTHKHFRSFFLIALIVLFASFSMAQDYDFEANESGMAVMEAENYSVLVPNTEQSTWIGDATVISEGPEGYSGDGFMKAYNPGSPYARVEDAISNAGYLGYNIQFSDPADYYIWLRASRSDPDRRDDSFHAVLAEGESIKDSVDMIAYEGEYTAVDDMDKWVWIYTSSFADTEGPAFVNIPSAGVYQFRIYIRERDAKIDKVLLTMNPLYIADSASTGPDETLPVSGINSKSLKNNVLSTFPNPVEDQLNIQIKDANYNNGVINIVNLQGQLVEKIVLDNRLSLDADVSHLASGVYLIKLEQNNTLISVDKLLKQ